VTDDDDDDVDDEYYPGKFTYKQYDVSHKSNTSLYSEDHLRLRAIGSSENLDVIAITNRGKKEVMLIFDKQQDYSTYVLEGLCLRKSLMH
jgi:hypothetical protein